MCSSFCLIILTSTFLAAESGDNSTTTDGTVTDVTVSGVGILLLFAALIYLCHYCCRNRTSRGRFRLFHNEVDSPECDNTPFRRTPSSRRFKRSNYSRNRQAAFQPPTSIIINQVLSTVVPPQSQFVNVPVTGYTLDRPPAMDTTPPPFDENLHNTVSAIGEVCRISQPYLKPTSLHFEQRDKN